MARIKSNLLGRQFRKRRQEKQLTQVQLCALTGVPTAQMSFYECVGINPSSPQARAIAAALDLILITNAAGIVEAIPCHTVHS